MAKNFCGCIQNGQRFSSTPSTTRRISRSFFFFFLNSQKERYYSLTSRRKVGNIFTINISSITKFVGYYGCNHTYASFLLTLLLLTVQFALHMSVNYTHRLFSKYCQIVIWGAISTPRVDNCKDRRLKLMKYDLAIHILCPLVMKKEF